MNSTMWKIALRTLARDKTYALLNVAGLALAIACCLILGVYLRSELTYDHSHVKYRQIFRIVNEFEINGKLDRFPSTSTMLGPMLKDENPDVEQFVRFQGSGQQKRFIQHGSDGYYWSNVYVTDPNVFDVFTHKVLFGDPKTALQGPTALAVSHTLAKRYFGDKNPLGETLTIDGNDAQITLVFEDLPENTHLKYDALLSTAAPQFATPDDVNLRRQRLFNIGLYTYLLMRPGYDAAKWPEVSRAFFARNMTEIGNRINAQWRSWLQPLADIHLHTDVPDQLAGNLYYLYGFVAVAVFTLVVACINYMNLATARAAKRAKEVGMRKILGSSRRALVAQFLVESLLLAMIAVVLGVLFVKLVVAFTPINELLGKPVVLDLLRDPVALAWAVGLVLLVGVGAGLYPAFYLSAVVPASALVGGSRSGGARSAGLREGLVFLQFTISIAVIACTLLMASQMRYISQMSLGFERENRVNVTLRGVDTITASDAIKTELLRNPNVLGVSWAASTMGGDFPINVIGLENNDGTIEQTSLWHMGVGPEFVKVMGFTILQGHGPDDEVSSAAAGAAAPGPQGPPRITEIIVNEAVVRGLHWKEALGKRFQLGQGPGAQTGTVVGVVKDFNFRSVHDAVAPFAIYRLVDNFSQLPPIARQRVTRPLVVNISGKDVPGTIDFLRETIRKFDPIHPFEFEFLDDSLNRLYASDQRLTQLIGIFAGFCIFIACLGLFGLASFTAAQRTREIGVRKVFGAGTSQIIALLAHRIAFLVIGAAVVASVVAYLVMSAWLDSFAFHTSINPAVFLIAALAGLGIAYLTVSLQSLKAARAHPVHALRYE